MPGRGQSFGGGSRWKQSNIPDEEIEGKVNEVVKDTVQDLRELARKSNTSSVDAVVEIFTGKLIKRLGGDA